MWHSRKCKLPELVKMGINDLTAVFPNNAGVDDFGLGLNCYTNTSDKEEMISSLWFGGK